MISELTIASTVGKALFPVIAKQLITTISSQLNPTDLERALKAGIKSAEEWDNAQSPQKHLFYHCEPKSARELVEKFFKDTGVQEELQKPLKEKTTPDLELLISIFNNKVKSDFSKLKFPEKSIENWLKRFVDAYFEQTNTYLKFPIAKADYLKQLSNYFDDVEFVGLKVKSREDEKSAKLPQIFVMPNVVEQVESSSLQLKRNFDFEKIENRQLNLLWEQQQIARLQPSSGKKFSAQKLLKESRLNKFVVLGEPGIGKTTLMSYFAVMLAEKQPEKLELPADIELLPILIRIRDLAKYPEKNILEYVRHFAKNIHTKELPPGFFEYWLDDGKALILLDGLDEIANPAERSEMVKRIESFLGQYSQNRAIITSRPAGYSREFFRTEEFPHYRLEKFDDSQIELFIKQWYESRLKNYDKAQESQKSLNKALAEQERIKLLARNPLLLTIIALIHRYNSLPKHRYQLYEQAVDTLLINWDEGKGIGAWKEIKYINCDDIKTLMEHLGYWIHTQGKTGDKEGGTLIEKEELITQVSNYISELDYQKQIPKHRAKLEAGRFVNHIRERSGLLNEQGQDRYAFVHKTFQEYLTAQEIRNRQEEGFAVVLDHVREHLHNPHWREVLLLLIAQQKGSNPKKVIEEVLKQDTPYEAWLHRDLFFVGSCLAENVEFKSDNADLIRDIFLRLVKLEVSDSKRVGYRIKAQVFKTICSLHETKFQSQALELLKESADLIDKVRLQEYRIELGETEEAIAELLSLLQDKSYEVRNSAAKALGNLGNASEQVITELLSLLQDKSYGVRDSAAKALGNLGNASEQVITELLSLLKSESEGVRDSAAEVLVKLGNASEQVITELLSFLKSESEEVRLSAAEVLVKLGNASEQVITELLSLLKSESEGVRFFAAEALGNLGNASEQVITELLSLLKSESEGVRLSAAEVLVKLGNASEQVITELLSLLKSESKGVRDSAAEVLVKLGNASEQVITELLSFLKSESEEVRLSAAEVLVKLGNASEQVITELLSLLKSESEGVRFFAAEALGNLGNASEQVITELLSLLKSESEGVRLSAAEVLVKLGNASEQVITELLSFLKSESEEVRLSAAEVLVKLGNASEQVITELLSFLKSESEGVRFFAAKALGNLGNASEQVITELLSLLQDENQWVRYFAAEALRKLGKNSSNVTPKIAQWISQHQDSEFVGKGIDVLWDLVVTEL
ncbi:putative signal transduction protein containing Nacht domain [Cylindrospermum sp. NIES-4074]|nr:putative signal transduction protein containing Nacht domain [Cylindrospermum sp. NIES-4074]